MDDGLWGLCLTTGIFFFCMPNEELLRLPLCLVVAAGVGEKKKKEYFDGTLFLHLCHVNTSMSVRVRPCVTLRTLSKSQFSSSRSYTGSIIRTGLASRVLLASRAQGALGTLNLLAAVSWEFHTNVAGVPVRCMRCMWVGAGVRVWADSLALSTSSAPRKEQTDTANSSNSNTRLVPSEGTLTLLLRRRLRRIY